MSRPTAIVADDEAILRRSIVSRLQRQWPELEIIGEAGDGIQALELIQTQKPDFAFLDIRMPGLGGMEVARQAEGPCRIVFITAHDQYAVDAFDAQAVDYLLKPVTEERLARTIERLKQPPALGAPNVPSPLQTPAAPPDYLRLIKVKTGSDIRFIPVAEIFFFKAEDKYTIVQTLTHEHLIRTPIKDLETRLDPTVFWRVHRSAIVNVDRIRVIKRSFTQQMRIGFQELEATIAVSRRYEHRFKQM